MQATVGLSINSRQTDPRLVVDKSLDHRSGIGLCANAGANVRFAANSIFAGAWGAT
jgi:hypothetical protein